MVCIGKAGHTGPDCDRWCHQGAPQWPSILHEPTQASSDVQSKLYLMFQEQHVRYVYNGFLLSMDIGTSQCKEADRGKIGAGGHKG